MEKRNSLKGKAVGGVFWSFVDKLANQGSQFLIQIILARLLLPEHFGLIGLILVFNAISAAIVDSGFSNALIREKQVTQKDYSTVFYFNLMISIIIYALLYASAPVLSNFFNEPDFVFLLRVLALGIVINSFGMVPRVMFAREINFKTMTKVNLTTSVISGISAVLMALNGFGVWSLIARVLIMNVLQSVLSLWVTKWLPSITFSLASFRRLFGFGWKLLVAELINAFYQNVYTLIIGKQFSADQLGFYTNAYRFSNMASQTLTATIRRVAYPILSSIQEEEDRLKQAYRKIIKTTAFLIFPIMIGLAAVGEPLIEILLGNQWMPMLSYFQLLCLAGMLFPIQAINLNVLQVKGRSDLFLLLEIAKIVVAAFFIVLAIWLDTGIIGLVIVTVLMSYIALFINTYFSGREISYPVREQIKDLFPIYISSLVMGGVVLTVGEIVQSGNVIQLVSQSTAGVLFYIFICKCLKINELNDIYQLLIPIVRKIRFSKI
ncbi:Membrane protein involved in the export of O-antigen and teichoic acid [Planococcus glaciei]|uniref:lipopolysaccharide biosynthesis protein n=1 Tax=Planococcus glaciei TaxID=459472 RepID=UPI00088CE186|nr:lipopolysaccharide biosynthesis protein [Planococcus glaciei]SDI33555.1 Membrane protein involved in the export of O-antigen and teichoic acid [Planococcus glaciei]